MEITRANYDKYIDTHDNLVLLASDNITRVDYIGSNAVTVNLSRNPVMEITCKLPFALTTLILTNTNISELPKLPDTLNILDLRGTNFPEGLRDYYIGEKEIARFKKKLKIKNYIKLI